jgi:hypothetical protein
MINCRALLIWARSLGLFLEAVALDRHRSGQDQQHANASSGCGVPLLVQVNDGPAQKEPNAQTDACSGEDLVPFHPKPTASSEYSKHGGRLTQDDSAAYVDFSVPIMRRRAIFRVHGRKPVGAFPAQL